MACRTAACGTIEELRVWQRARRLAIDIYGLTDEWPQTERYGMTSQIRRAAVSIGANLAERCGRGTDKAYAQFVGYAIGSLNEVDHFLVLAHDLGITNRSAGSDAIAQQIEELGKMLYTLRGRKLGGAAMSQAKAGGR